MILLLACSQPTGITATLSEEVATVVELSWEGGPAHVEFGLDSLDRSTPVQDGQALLLGLPADSELRYRVVPEQGRASEEASISTGSLPQELPGTEVSGGGHEGFLVSTVLGNASGPLILDDQGRIVWYRLDDRGLDNYRARLSVDGQSLLYNAGNISGEVGEDTEIVRVSMNGQVLERIAVPHLAHDFVELGDGSLIAMTVDGEDPREDVLVEVDSQGGISEIWRSSDCFELEDMDEGFANALDVSEDEDKLRLSFRTWSSIVQIDRATGDCDWVLGQLDEAHGVDSPFLGQHQFQVLDGSLLVFDNEGLAGSQSRAAEYDFEVDQPGDAELIWSYAPQPSVFSFVLGDVHRAADGDTLVVFSASGQVDRVDPEGGLLWRLNTDIGYALGFTQVVDDLYDPELP